MQSEVDEEILSTDDRIASVYSLTFCTIALMNYISIKPDSKLLIDLVCSV